MSQIQGSKKRKTFTIELLVIFAILVSLGFPGNFTEIYGDRLGMIMEYAAFFIEILVMLFSSGDTWLDIRVINLERRYSVLYIFAIVLYLVSMLVTRYPSLQAITCTRLCVTLLFAIWLQEQFSFERMLELLCAAQVIFVLMALLFIAIYPGEAFESGETYVRALKGLYPTKNTFASELCFGITILCALIREKRKKMQNFTLWIAVLVIQMILLFMCQAMGAVFCLLAVFAVLLLPKHRRLPLGWGYIGVNIFFLFAMLTLMPHFEWFFEAIGKDATLTGRIPLWNQIITVMMNHNTFTGFGYGMFWRDPAAMELIQAGFDRNSFMGNISTGAHNVILEFWVNNGLIGIAALFAALLYSMRNIQQIQEEKYVFASLLITYLLVNGLTERCLTGNYDYKILTLFLVFAMCCNRSDDIKYARKVNSGLKNAGRDNKMGEL